MAEAVAAVPAPAVPAPAVPAPAVPAPAVPAPSAHAAAKQPRKVASSSRARQPAGPRVTQLITKALSASKERSGLSLAALKKALAAAGYDVERNSSHIKLGLKRLVSNGILVHTRGPGASGSFKLNKKPSGTKRKARKKKPAVKKPKKAAAVKRSPKKVKKAAQSPRRATRAGCPRKAAKSLAKLKAVKPKAGKRKAAKRKAAKAKKAAPKRK